MFCVRSRPEYNSETNEIKFSNEYYELILNISSRGGSIIQRGLDERSKFIFKFYVENSYKQISPKKEKSETDHIWEESFVISIKASISKVNEHSKYHKDLVSWVNRIIKESDRAFSSNYMVERIDSQISHYKAGKLNL